MTKKQKWVLNYLKDITCASEHELAKHWSEITKGYLKPTQYDAFNMHVTLDTLIKVGLVHMEKDPFRGYKYYSLV